MAITKTNRLNMTGGGVPVIVRLSQYDDDFTLVFELYSTDGAFTIPSGTTAEVRGTKSDGKGFSASATIDITNKKVTVTGDHQMTAVSGKNIFELTLWKSNKELNTANFILDVEPAALDRNTIVSESKIMELLDVTDRADEIIDAAETIESSAAQIAINTQNITAIEEEIASMGSGLSDDAKIALLNCFEHVAWIDEHGQNYYDALEAALDIGVTSITASFDQSDNVFTSTDELDDLRPFLTVTGIKPGGSEELQNYTLSGNLNSSTSTITVTYNDLTTTFNVSVTTLPSGYTLKNYVQTDGTQYIASGLYETELLDTWTRYKASVSQELDRAGHVLSSTNEFTPYMRYFANSSARQASYNRFGSQTTTYTNSVIPKWNLNEATVIESYKEEGKIYFNGIHMYTITPGTTASSSNQLYLFTYGGAITNTTYRFYGKLYYFKIFNTDGTKAHDFVPCRNSSNVAGLYDLVTGVFHSPASGTLVTD